MPLASFSQRQWQFDAKVAHAYDLVLDLQTQKARELLTEETLPEAHYVTSLAEALELLLSEDPSKLNIYELNFQERISKLDGIDDARHQFALAEIRLHWVFVHLKFGHQFDAIIQLRQALSLAETCRAKNPDFIPIQKTTGLLDILIGSVPEKYTWMLGLLGISGNGNRGLQNLSEVCNSPSSVAFESRLLFSFIEGYILQKSDSALLKLRDFYEDDKQRPPKSMLLLSAALAIKNSNSELALQMLTLFKSDTTGLSVHYAEYLRGEASLHNADYVRAISSYQNFIDHYRGLDHIKDAHYKIGICHWLSGSKEKAEEAFNKARSTGNDHSEADKYASRNLSETTMPHVELSKVRYYTDGGYYHKAQAELDRITSAQLSTTESKAEYYYRKARLAHKQHQLPAAKLFYQQTIEMCSHEPWYYAPNSCLQLGYLALDQNNVAEAKQFFERALGYENHPYKNSIDSKAKSALSQISRK